MKKQQYHFQLKEEKSPERTNKEIELITLPEPEFKKSGNKNSNRVKKEH